MTGPAGILKRPSDQPKEPSPYDVLRKVMRQLRLDMRTSVPCTVVAFTPAPVPGPVPPGTGGNASVSVLVGTLQVNKIPNPTAISKTAILVNPARNEQTLAPIQLNGVPVEYPGGAGGGITWPILPGDTGRLAVSDRSMDRWLAAGRPTDPIVAATHMLHDSVFVPGLRSLVTALTAVDMTGLVIDGLPLVKIGPTAVESITKAESLMIALIQAVTASATVPMDGGASFKAALLAQLATIQAQIGTPAGIGSVKGKVE